MPGVNMRRLRRFVGVLAVAVTVCAGGFGVAHGAPVAPPTVGTSTSDGRGASSTAPTASLSRSSADSSKATRSAARHSEVRPAATRSKAARAAAPAIAGADLHGQVAYLPVTTRTTQADPSAPTVFYGVTINGTFYSSSTVQSTEQPGYQALIVSRSWSQDSGSSAQLTGGPENDGIIQNQWFSADNAEDVQTMYSWVTDATNYGADCAAAGCYLIIASLYGMGYTSCSGVAPNSTGSCAVTNAQPGADFANLGGSYEASFAAAGSNYSLLTPVTYTAASNTDPPTITFPGLSNGYEALSCVESLGTCTPRPRGSSAGPANGSVFGAFVGSDPSVAISYTPTNQAAIASRQITVKGSSAYNTVVISANGRKSYASSALVPSTNSAFQVVQIDRTSMEVLANSTYQMNSAGPVNTTNRAGMVSDLQNPVNGTGENTIWVISSIGTVNSANAGTSYREVAQWMAGVGASFTVVNQLGVAPAIPGSDCPTSTLGDYTLIGWDDPPTASGAPLGATPPVETSGPVGCTTKGPQSLAATNVTENAVLALNQRGLYSAQSWDAQPGAAGLQSAVLRNSDAGWPAVSGGGSTPTAGQLAAYTSLSDTADSTSDGDIRSLYQEGVRNKSTNAASTWQSNVSSASYPQGASFSQQDFAAVQQELNTELASVVAVAYYQNQMTTVLLQVDISSGSAVTGAWNTINTSLNKPPGKASTLADIVTMAGALADDFTCFLPEAGVAFDAIGAAAEAIGELAGFSISTVDAGNNQAAIAGLQTTWANLQAAIPAVFAQQVNALDIVVSLAAVDPVRLANLAAAVQSFNSTVQDGTISTDDIAGAYVRSASVAYFTAYLNVNWFVYTKLAFNNAQDAASADATDSPYPFTGPANGVSLHTIVCADNGTCGAQKASPANYFIFLSGPNPNATPQNGDPTMLWGVDFVASAPNDCGLFYCDANFPADAAMDDLFDIPSSDLSDNASGNLGLYPGYFYDRFSALNAANSYNECLISQVNIDGGPCGVSETIPVPPTHTPTTAPSNSSASRPGSSATTSVMSHPAPATSSGTAAVPSSAAPTFVAGGGALASTGVDVTFYLIAAAALLGGGTGLSLLARRRRGHRV